MTDTFRKVYRPLKQENTDLVLTIKNKAEELESLLLQINSREMSLAKTHLEEVTMWATKTIILHDEKNNHE